MAEIETVNAPRSERRLIGCLALLVLVVGLLACVTSWRIRELRRAAEQYQAERLQRAFQNVKDGNDSPYVMDSKLLPMLANDAKCRVSVTRLDFTETTIDSSDARYVAQLPNVTSMSFYCTRGTKDVLLAARALPIEELYFEMPDLPIESYLMLKDFPQLKKFHIEQVVEDEWIARLKEAMPAIEIDIPFPQSKESNGRK